MTFDLRLFSTKLKKYREQLDKSIEEVSDSTGITVEDLTSLETEGRRPTGDEVLILSDYYLCDYQYFISNEQLAPFEQTETLYRKYGDEFSKQDRWAIQEFLFLCECEAFLFQNLPRIECNPFSFTKTGNFFKRHGKDAANSLRNHFGYSTTKLGQDIYDDFRRLGFHLFRRELSNSNISGLYIKHPTAGKCILVNYGEDVYRQRFTVAHETAHAILDDDKDFVVSFTWDKKNLVEIRANSFASNYLMPQSILNQIPNPDFWTERKVIDWADKLRVSTTALAIALKEANLVSPQIETYIRSIKVPTHMKTDPELPEDLSTGSRERRKQALKRGLSTFYVNLCFDAYEQKIVSAGRLAEMLLITSGELGEIARVYGRPIKYAD